MAKGKGKKKQKGGLCLKSCNMDQGAPFHPIWGGSKNCGPINASKTTYAGGSRKKSKKQKGGTSYYG